MRKKIVFIIIAIALVTVFIWFWKKNNAPVITYQTSKPFKTNIVKKTVATGKVVPLEEVEIKPQIAGIINKIVAQEGAIVKTGDLIATVRVVPNIQSLNRANGNVKNAKLTFDNQKVQFGRDKKLFEKGVISRKDFESSELKYQNARQNLANAQSDLDIINKGTTVGLGNTTNTNIRATSSGMILEIPVKKGYQVTQTNDFNAGTTIARIADMTKMIFEGQVDESDVGNLVKGKKIEIVLAAIPDKKFPANLSFIAPKGTEVSGAVQFTIKADLSLDDKYFVRAGYSANAEIVLAKKDSVLAIKESLLQFDKKNQKPYVEVQIKDQEFERKDLELGVSDGVNVEVIKGVNKDDNIKIWNKITGEDFNENMRRKKR